MLHAEGIQQSSGGRLTFVELIDIQSRNTTAILRLIRRSSCRAYKYVSVDVFACPLSMSFAMVIYGDDNLLIPFRRQFVVQCNTSST
jgi:hypothetical protein